MNIRIIENREINVGTKDYDLEMMNGSDVAEDMLVQRIRDIISQYRDGDPSTVVLTIRLDDITV